MEPDNREKEKKTRLRPSRQMILWGITAFFVGLALILAVFLVFRGSAIRSGYHVIVSILSPVIIGGVVAFILTPVVNKLERSIFAPLYRKAGVDIFDTEHFAKHARAARGFSIAISMIVLVSLMTSLVVVVFPQVWESVMTLFGNLREYAGNLELLAEKWLEPYPEVYDQFRIILAEATQRITKFFNESILPRVPEYLDFVTKSIRQVLTALLDIIVGLVVAAYLLGFKERLAGMCKKFNYAFFRERVANRIIEEARFVNKTFTGFLVGKIIDSMIIGVLCYIGCLIFKFPYAILVSVVVGVTNIIPYFGPYIGGVFGFLLLLMIKPLTAVYFGIFVLVLQQFDGNILGPRILGSSIGIPSFWVLFSILLFGGLFGLVGMVFGVPVFAVIYHLMGLLLDTMLSRKQMETSTEEYIRTERMEGGQIVHRTRPDEKPRDPKAARFPKNMAKFLRRDKLIGKDEDKK